MARAEKKGENYIKQMSKRHTYDYFADPGLKFRENYYEAFTEGCEVIEGAMNPRVDLLFDAQYAEMKKRSLYAIYPELKGKKVLLYTPTFRGFAWKTIKLKNGQDKQVVSSEGRKNTDAFMDFDKVLDSLSDEWVIIIKRHPSMRDVKYAGPSERNRHRFFDMAVNVNTLMLIADLMVCDYSSTFFEMAMLDKPIVFFANDIDSYLDERGFFYDFYDFVPGEICKDEYSLCAAIEKVMASEDPGKRSREFVKEYFGEVSHNNAENFADFVAEYVNRNGKVVEKKHECRPFWFDGLNKTDEQLKVWANDARKKYDERIRKIHERNDK